MYSKFSWLTFLTFIACVFILERCYYSACWKGMWNAPLQVLFGTADGQVIVMDCHGRMLAHVLLHESDGIVSMSWNCPDFLVEDSTESDTDSDDSVLPLGRKTNSPKLQYLAILLYLLPTAVESKYMFFSLLFKCTESSLCWQSPFYPEILAWWTTMMISLLLLFARGWKVKIPICPLNNIFMLVSITWSIA